ncbi:hypothetical protein ACWDUN_21005 [Mycobacterium sp. NPDC003323]
MIAAVAATAVCAVAASGCSGVDENPPPAPQLDVRHDVEGLAATIPAIGAPESVSWVQWSDPAAARWTDAVVLLAPAVVDALIAQFSPTGTGRAPQVADELRAQVPPGPYLSGERLDAGFSTDVTSAYAFLDRERATLVLQATSLDG